LKLEFISNTGCYLEHDGVVFGMDPWLTQGAFEGSWFHFPPLRPTKWSVRDCKYIYVSHLHPDHCDFHALRDARPSTRFVVPDYFNRLLERKLKAFGFQHVVSLPANGRAELEPGLQVDLFPQFKNNLFHEAAFGNLIDSALCLQWGGRTILNCNDNYLTEGWARKLRRHTRASTSCSRRIRRPGLIPRASAIFLQPKRRPKPAACRRSTSPIGARWCRSWRRG
jgi:hypothetical protein